MNRNDSAGNMENIELSLPVNSAYVSAARLTSSSIAERLGFDDEEIEEIKTTVSEACSLIIRKAGTAQNATFRIVFVMAAGFIEMSIFTDVDISTILDNEADNMTLLIFSAFMDSHEMTAIAPTECDEPVFCISLKKQHKETDL